MTLISDYRQMSRNLPATLRQAAAAPDVKRQSENYLEKIGKVKSVDDFMNDDEVYSYALTAFGLKDMLYAKAFIRKVLVEGIDSPKAFSVKLADSRFREFATAFNFASYGSAATAFARTQQGTVDRYVRNALEESAGNRDERLRLALYFERKAPSVTGVYGILADKALYTVVRSALGLPAAISSAEISKQAALISSRVNVADFNSPEKLSKFLDRYLANAGAEETGRSSAGSSPALALMQDTAASVDLPTLLSIQSMKRYNS